MKVTTALCEFLYILLNGDFLFVFLVLGIWNRLGLGIWSRLGLGIWSRLGLGIWSRLGLGILGWV